MKEKLKPILFNTDMVSAILDGRKTVSRRIIKPQPDIDLSRDHKVYIPVNQMHGLIKSVHYPTIQSYIQSKALYQTGDIIYVRETWAEWTDGYVYKVPDPKEAYNYPNSFIEKWHPSIHMPKEAARIFLRVKDVRVERLQDITVDGMLNEGLRRKPERKPIYRSRYQLGNEFFSLWNSTVKKSDIDRYGWTANPWVWVIEFERISMEVSA